MGKDSGGGTPNPNQTVTQLTDPAKLPYYTRLWDDTMKLYEARKTPAANPFGIWDTTPVGGGPISSWTDRNGKDMTVGNVGAIDWSKYFGKDVANPYAPAYLAENPTAKYQYQGLEGTKTAPGTALNPKPAAPVTPVVETPKTVIPPFRFGSFTYPGGVADATAAASANTPIAASQPAGGELGAATGGYINPYAEGGTVRHFAEGGIEGVDPYMEQARALYSGNDTAQAYNPDGASDNALSYWADQIKNQGMDQVQGDFSRTVDQYAKDNPLAAKNAADTANDLSGFEKPDDVTNPYEKTSYTATDYDPDSVKAQTNKANTMSAARDVNATNFNANQMAAARDVNAPTYNQQSMQQAPDINAQTVAAQTNNANQMNKPTEATAASMSGIAGVDKSGIANVDTGKFTDPGNVESYMNPYQKAATDVAIRESRRTSDIQQNKADASALQAGAFGGYRQGIENAESQRNQARLESDITAKGQDAAYQQALAAYNADQARNLTAQQTNTGQNLQAALANQGAETTMKVQNLTADQQTRLANLGMATTVGQANLTAAQQTALANQATNLQGQQANQQANLAAQQANQNTATQTGIQNLNANLTVQQQQNDALQAAQQANQAADLTRGQANLSAAQQTQGINSQQLLASQQANQAADLTKGQANLSAAQQTALANQATNLQGQTANQQAGIAANQQNNQNKQFGAQLGQTSEAQNAQYGIQSQLANIDNAYRAAGVNLTGGQLNAQLAQQQANTGIAALQNDTSLRAQDLNMSQFQTQTTQNMLAAMNKQYGDIQNWPMAQLQSALAALKT